MQLEASGRSLSNGADLPILEEEEEEEEEDGEPTPQRPRRESESHH